MSLPAKGRLLVQVGPNDFEDYEIQYNPTELTFDKGVQLAELGVPGLDAPVQQFVRGNAEKLTLELFCDSTDQGTGVGATSVTQQTDRLYQLVKIVPALHAPPVVTFFWHHEFPGARTMAAWGNHRRTSFTGVAESVRQRFTMFSPEGVPLRATVTLTLREWRPIESQLHDIRPESPDRTHWHMLAAGQTLDALAARFYGRAGDWRAIAAANALEDPRRLVPGTTLVIPALR